MSKCMWIGLVVAAGMGCSKPDKDAPAAAPPVGSAKPAEAPPAAAPPTVTTDMLFATEPKWSVEALPRGLYTRVNTGPVEHKCRQEFAMTWVQNSQLRTAAAADAGATTCGPKAGLTVCTYTKPGGTPATEPKDLAHWVFTGSDAEPILIAALYGTMDDWAALAPQLTTIKPCPRPSDDPK